MVSGGITGGMAGLTLGGSTSASVAMGAAKGAVGYGVDNFVYNGLKGNNLTDKMSVESACLNAVWGGISSGAIKGIESISTYLKPDLSLPVGQISLLDQHLYGGDLVSVTAYESSKKIINQLLKEGTKIGYEKIGMLIRSFFSSNYGHNQSVSGVEWGFPISQTK